ncbi:alpha beta hydrolase fold protein [Moniliophthora roreri]|uniref:Alpha/beta hydrolase fold-3 domain-containing protein n=1 Tax=Moniliophthora roreri TaxID=221103 RepID=A0A0W0G3N6_MONRR|nr:alpha beta hydrolase fold protein [Moniliophthora roreri]
MPRLLKKYGDVSFGEKVQIWLVFLKLPFALAWKLLTSKFYAHSRYKTWRHNIGEAAFRAIGLSIPQMQYVMGGKTTLVCYKDWSSKRKLSVTVEEIQGEEARLLWIGGKRTDRVIYYLHGGGYALPLQEYALSFWRHVQEELERKGLDVGVVVLNYALIPDAPFPTVLRQAIKGLQLLLDDGVKPENLQLSGDSAGGNLVLQVLSHLLNPVPNVPSVTCGVINGAYLMSPWVSFKDEDGTHAARAATDVITTSGILEFGEYVLRDVPNEQQPYIELNIAPETWWNGLDKVVKRVFMSVGRDECFLDDIVKLDNRMKTYHSDVKMVVQEYGVHCDPYIDFMIPGEKRFVELTGEVVDWVADGFSV